MIKKNSLIIIALFYASFYGFGQEIASFSSVNSATCSGIIYNDPNASANGICRGSGISQATGGTYNSSGWEPWASPQTNDYLEWSITPNSGYEIDLSSIDIRYDRSGTGPSGLQLQIDTGSGFNTIHTDNSVSDTGENLTLSLASYLNLTTTVTFRIYAYSASSGGGTFDIEQHTATNKGVIINGSVNLILTDDVDWCNVQSPANGTIFLADTFNVYAQGWENGVTNSPGQGAGVLAWIGYSSADTDPSGGGWTWVAATYNMDVADNDEFVADIGAVIPATGTYYYASRFQLNGGPYRYGGYNGGFWDGVTNVNGVLTINPRVLDWCNLQSPATGSINTGDTFDVYAQVYEVGITDTAASQGANIEAWIGYSEADTNPSGTGWIWISANYNPLCGANCGTPENNDEYFIDIGSTLNSGTYYYASRFRIDGASYYYGGYNAGGGGFWDGTNNVNGVLTVTDPPNYACVDEDFVDFSDWTNNGTAIDNTHYGNAAPCRALGAGDDIISPSVDFPSNLQFYQDSSNGGNGQTATVEYRIGAGAWVSLYSFNVTTAGNTENVDLTNVGGVDLSQESDVTFRFNSSFSTWYLDDVVVTCSNSCTATHTITGFSPASGPENTIVTITGTGFTAGTTVSFNGASATILSQTATSLEVYVPGGASSGVITVTEASCGLESSMSFTVIDSVNSGCEGSVTTTDLIISEITDATYGSLSYIEIYNGTGSAVDLSDYTIEIRYNAGGTENSFNMTGTLAAGGVHVISTTVNTPCPAITGADGSLSDEATTMNGIDSAKNDADCVSLYKNYVDDSNPGTLIDVWGDCSDKNWRENLGVAIGNEGFNFRRLTSASPLPNTTFTLSDWNIIDWADNACTDDDYSDIGTYSSGLAPSITVNPSASTSCNLTAMLTVSATEGYNGGGDTQELAYQWYYSAPGDAGWTSITDNATYSGSTTATLTISNVLNTLDYQFYCQVREDDATCYQASDATRLDVQRTTWDGSSWDNGSPDLTTIAIIDGGYDTSINGNFQACNLLVNTGKTLDIKNATYVTVQNNAVIDGTIIVQTKGTFVQVDNSGTFTNNGLARVVKNTTLLNNWYDYTFWSSPVTGEILSDAFPNTPSNRRYLFNASNYADEYYENNNDDSATFGPGVDDIDDNGDDWQIAAGATVMTPGVGYAATSSPAGMFPMTDIATFEGSYNTGTITSPVVVNSVALDNDWNLLGNPYPGAVDVNTFFSTNNSVIDQVIYLWSHASPPLSDNNGNQVLNFLQDDYAVINNSGEMAGGDGLIPNRYIPSGQGFFVRATTSGNVTFNNGMRLSDTTSNDQFFEANNASQTVNLAENNKLWINLRSDNGVFNQLLMAYVEGATDANDGFSYDAARNLSSGKAAIIYTMIEGEDLKKFAIQGKHPNSLHIDEVIPLGFNTTIEEATIYTLSVAQFEGPFMDSNTIYLNDHLLGTTHNLSESDYNFTSETGVFEDRFEIVFTQETLSLGDSALNDNALVIIELANGDVQFKVSSHLEMKSIEIIDVLGRTLYQFNTNGSSRIFQLDALSQSTYIAKVELTNGFVFVRKAVKQR